MAPFDPYHKWLGIPPEEQAPNHYRLLGVPLFESDPDVIDGAAEQRTIYLRTFQTGPNAELAERLLNEVSEARICLLIEADKASYDQQLQTGFETVQGDHQITGLAERAVLQREAEQERQRAQQEREEAEAVRRAAMEVVSKAKQSAAEAQQERKKAQQERLEAEEAREAAQKAVSRAQQERQEAEEAQRAALAADSKAKQSAADAEQERQEAEEARGAALQAQSKAEQERQEAEEAQQAALQAVTQAEQRAAAMAKERQEVEEARGAALQAQSKAEQERQVGLEAESRAKQIAAEEEHRRTSQGSVLNESQPTAAAAKAAERRPVGSKQQKSIWRQPRAITVATGGVAALFVLVILLISGDEDPTGTEKQNNTTVQESSVRNENTDSAMAPIKDILAKKEVERPSEFSGLAKKLIEGSPWKINFGGGATYLMVAFRADGSFFADDLLKQEKHGNGKVTGTWTAESEEKVSISYPDTTESVTISDEGSRIYARYFNDGSIRNEGAVVESRPVPMPRQPGTLAWKFATGGAVESSPAIGEGGAIYFGSWDPKLYAFDSSNPDLIELNTSNSLRVVSIKAILFRRGTRSYLLRLSSVTVSFTSAQTTRRSMH